MNIARLVMKPLNYKSRGCLSREPMRNEYKLEVELNIFFSIAERVKV